MQTFFEVTVVSSKRKESPGEPMHVFDMWCREGDSNSHGQAHWNLNPARLPIPPPRQEARTIAQFRSRYHRLKESGRIHVVTRGDDADG